MNTILIIDDSSTSRMVLRVYLQALGETCVFDAADKEQAMQMALRCNPDIVFMDYNLDEANGVEIATEMREQGVVAKFILLTGSMAECEFDDALQAGFDQVLEKPIAPEDVESIINSI